MTETDPNIISIAESYDIDPYTVACLYNECKKDNTDLYEALEIILLTRDYQNG